MNIDTPAPARGSSFEQAGGGAELHVCEVEDVDVPSVPKSRHSRQVLARSVEVVLARAVTHALVGLEPRRVEVEAHVQRRRCRRSRSSACADRACRRRASASAAGIAVGRAGASRAGASRSTSRRPSCARRAPASTCRSRSRCSPRRSRCRASALERHAAVGELALDGRLRRVGGVLAVAEGARRLGLERLLCPAESAPEAALAGVERDPGPPPRRGGRLPARRARARAGVPPRRRHAAGRRRPTSPTSAARSARGARSRSPPRAGTTCCSAGRRARARRCSRGGCRASCRRSTRDEALEVTRIHSVAGLLAPSSRSSPRRRSARRITARRPRRSSAAARGSAPARRASRTAACCSSTSSPSSARPALEALRQPLEDGVVAVARAAGRVVFPARFQLVATMNLCPCGARGDPAAQCTCSAQRLAALPRQALARAARPLRPRRRDAARRAATSLPRRPAEASAAGCATRVVAARERLGGRAAARRRRRTSCCARAVDRLPLSGRGRARVGARRAHDRRARRRGRACGAEHVAEALAYRSPEELAT